MRPDDFAPYTLDLLQVLGRLIALEPKQADLLSRICDSRLLNAEELGSAGALADAEQKPIESKRKGKSKA